MPFVPGNSYLIGGHVAPMRYKLLFVLSLLISCLNAQEFRATITGTVTDVTGGVVADARITATNVGTQIAQSANSNSIGSYVLPLLPPGKYTVTVERNGFKRSVRENVVLEIQSRVTLDATLEPGDVASSVSVSAEVPLLETASSSRGTVISGQTLVDLPLNGRNAFALAQLDPGVSFTSRGQANTFFRTTANGGISSFSANGGQFRSNESLLDGVPNTGTDGLIQYVPSVDATSEFRVQTNSFDAEFGRFTGAVINAMVRSGTNDLHGTLFNFTRNSYWNARDPFAANIPQFGYNVFGGSVGGPVWIPKVYKGKNRTFFFFNYEGSREGVPRANVATVPTQLQRQGDFSQTSVRSGSQLLPVTIYDPATTRLSGATYVRDPFPGNVIPPNRQSAVGRQLLNLYPLPNALGDPATGINNYLSSFKDPVSDDGFVVKIDHRFSDRHSVFGRYSVRTFNVGRQGTFKNFVTGDAESRRAPGVALDDTFVINPTTVLNIRYGYNRFLVNSKADNYGADLGGFGFPAAFISALPVQALPQINVGNGYATLSGATKLNKSAEDGHTIRGSIAKNLGRHSIRTGAEFRLLESNTNNLGANGAGQFSFDQVFTRGPNPQVAAANSGFSLASLLLGVPASGTVSLNASSADRTTYYGFFIQDDFRVNSRLTINGGVRYEFEGPYTERYNRLNRGFDTTTDSPVAAAAKAAYAAAPIPELPASQFQVKGGLLFAGVNGQPRSLSDIDRNNIAPRIGFAYQLNPKTVLRGGYGMFYGASTQTAEARAGFSVSTTYVASNDGNLTAANSLSNPFPIGLQNPRGASDGLLTLAGQGISFTSTDRRQPLAQQYSVNIQRQFGWGMIAEAAYVGTLSRDLPVNKQLNAIPEQFRAAAEQTFLATQRNTLNDTVNNPFFGVLTTGTLTARTITRGQLLRPYPQFTSVVVNALPEGSSRYDALQTKLSKRFSQGVSFTGAYTFAKQLDRLRYLNDQDTRLTKEVNDFDTPHRLVISTAYELPFGPGRRYFTSGNRLLMRIVEGFQANVLFQAASGIPIEVTGAESLGRSARLDVDQQSVQRWFDTSAFRLRQPLELARTSRLSDVRAAGRSNVDLSLFKTTRIRENVKLQFRAEAFNALNRPEWSSPNSAFGTSSFGVVTSTNTFARQLQFALKLLF